MGPIGKAYFRNLPNNVDVDRVGIVANAKAANTMLEISEIIAGASAQDLQRETIEIFLVGVWNPWDKCPP